MINIKYGFSFKNYPLSLEFHFGLIQPCFWFVHVLIFLFRSSSLLSDAVTCYLHCGWGSYRLFVKKFIQFSWRCCERLLRQFQDLYSCSPRSCCAGGHLTTERVSCACQASPRFFQSLLRRRCRHMTS